MIEHPYAELSGGRWLAGNLRPYDSWRRRMTIRLSLMTTAVVMAF